MLEGLAAWILNTYVGEYFENLNTDQLSVGLLQGAVELENLPLKKDALNHLGYPIEVRAGHIGKVKLQIPVYRLRSEPWVIFIEKLFIVIGPVQSFSYNENKEETADLKRKLTRLEAKDIERKAAQNDKQQSYMYTNWKSYSTSVFASIAENLQLNVRDVHIRYEDDVCIPDRPFACGIIIRGLAAQSTDEKWAPQFIEQSTSEMMWKLIQLDGLSVYWDTNAVMIGSLETELMKASMIKHMEACVLPDASTKDHEYVLASVDATARFKRNCCQQALRSHSTPRIVCDIQFEKIPLFLSKSQYRLILEWEKGFNSLHTKWSNRKWRPSVPVTSNSKTWWDYAVSVHLEPLRLKKKTRTWSFVLQRAKDLTEYTKVYREYLKQPETLSPESSATKENLETKLGYNELCFLRDLVIDRVRKEKIASGSGEKESVGQGFLQWLFPRWVGWYASPATNSTTEQTCAESEAAESMEMKSKLEEEILGVLDTTADDSLLKRDAIFAQMNFCLVQGTFVLLDDVEYVHQDSSGRCGKPLVELEFSDVLTRFETRPRSSSALFEIKLGALYIHDRIFNNSCFPHLIAPQSRDTYYVSSGSMLFQFPSSIVEENKKKDGERHLFELLYEKNPFNRRYDHKLVVKTKSLDVIFNSELVCVITNFFKLPSSSSDKSLLSAASAQYEILKQQTKAELQQTWDKIMIGEQKHKKRWFIELDISAPQIIIPENIFDANTTVVVFDLGELHILNSAKAGISDSASNSCDFDDEDDFHTPCSTPKELLSQSESSNTLRSLDSEPINGAHFLYECYTLELKNMQVLVSSLKDSWKFAQLRGSSSLHILNRFSVNIQAHRRTVLVEDSQYPSLAFVACLPKLTLHISEHKINALKSCIKHLSAQFNGPSESQPYTSQDLKLTNSSDLNSPEVKSSSSNAGSSVLLLLQFCIDQMIFDIESRSQSVAELQVSGLKTSLSKCGNETSLMLCVHSLLVVDALQTYGPDFELLVASHKRVSMDNSSGKLRNTDPTDTSDFFSLSSPPAVPCSSRAESPLEWSTFEKQLREQSFSDALIFFEFKILKPSENSPQELQIASVHFNNLDVIANQETIIEIVGLFRRLTQDSDQDFSISKRVSRSGSVSEFEFPSAQSSKKVDITFNFHRLNILLLRAMSQSCAGQKLATATLSGTQIKAEIGSCIKICGTLGGLQVLDLVTEGNKFPKIISLGNIPTQHSYVLQTDPEESSANLSSSADSQEAFSFTIIKRDYIKKREQNMNSFVEQEDACELDISVRMASLCYSHSPRLLYELTCCASEFKSYLRSVAHSIRTAAAEVAKGIVSKRYDSPSFSFVEDNNKSPFVRHQNETLSSNMGAQYQEQQVPLTFRIDVFLKSPIVILPCSSTQPEVFFAHLGHIAVYNKLCHRFPINHPFLYSIEEIKDDSLFLEVNGMNMFFVNVDTELNSESSENYLDFSTYEASDDSAILHDTTLEIFIIPMKELMPTFYQSSAISGDMCFEDDMEMQSIAQNQFTIKGDVTPLKVVFTKHQYRKMFELLDNLTYTAYSSPDASSCTSPSTKLMKCSSLSHSDLSTNLSATSPSDTAAQVPKNRSFLVLAKFELPSFTVELRDDLNIKESLVSLTFQEFTLTYENKNSFETMIQATLSALLMEDLRDVTGANQPCILMSSKQSSTTQGSVLPHSSRFISTSCPNISEFYPKLQWGFSASLPNYLCTENMFQLQNDYRMKAAMKPRYKRQSTKSLNASCPNTPPPSPSASVAPSPEPDNTLVNVKVLAVDEQSPHFITKHKKTHLSISIDLNCLDVILNLHSWILVFEFFDSVSSTPSKENANQNLQRQRTFSNEGCSCPGNVQSNSIYNSELEIKVRSLVVTLSKPEYDLASANVTHFYSQISKREDSFSLKGKLGGISVSDLTPFGHRYPERFVTTGAEAMHFNIFRHAKYSSPHHHSASDIHVEVQMSSVMYVHTQRFVTDIITFLQYFHQKQCFVAGAQFETSDCPVHGSPLYASRIRLNILADTPILVIPQNSSSTEVFVVSLGMLTVNNKIVGGGLLDITESPHPADRGLCVIPSFGLDQSSRTHKAPIPTLQAGMIFQKVNRALSIDEFCMLDIINIEIKDADVFSAIHTNFHKKERRRFSAIKGSIRGQELIFPSYVLQKRVPLLKEKVTFKIQVERNIDVGISHKVPDFKICGMLSSVHVTLDLDQYKVFRGILKQNLGETLEEWVYDPCKEVSQFVLMNGNFEVWTTLAFNIDLVNVTLELHDYVVGKNAPLAKFDFINSRFSYEILSDNTSDIDFVSNEIRITDIREKANTTPNVFRTILTPMKQGSSGNSVLQAELHYRVMHDLMKITVLLNNMRVMGILDFLQSTLQFLTCPLPVDDSLLKSISEIESYQEPSPTTEQKSVMEIKINVSNTEFVLPEDTSQLDSSAVFLKSTAVIFWKPDNVEKPLSCGLQSLEMFSCILGIEDDTALSIIDPVNLIVEVLNKPSSPIANLESGEEISYSLEISAANLYIRLSYNDLLLFLKILESIKKQTGMTAVDNPSPPANNKTMESAIQRLSALGFTTNDCAKALAVCNDNLNDAAMWLMSNALPTMDVTLDASPMDSSAGSESGWKKSLKLSSIELRIDSVGLCIIDDCRNADVPVLEICLLDFDIFQKMNGGYDGHGLFTLSTDYYNCSVSGWEPLMEPWRCKTKWSLFQALSKPSKKYIFHISSDDSVNINITSSFLNLYKTVKKNWTEDYLSGNFKNSTSHRRSQFVPFALKNNTGCKLWFTTQVIESEKFYATQELGETRARAKETSLTWKEVASDEISEVRFENRMKLRHKDSHQMKLHQIIVRIEGWKTMTPVSVDRVGIYFRCARPQNSPFTLVNASSFQGRVLFSVVLENSARKLITVQSALSVLNKLNDTLEMKLEYPVMCHGAKEQTLFIVPNEEFPIPLPFVHAQIWVRPINSPVLYSDLPIFWQHLTQPGEMEASIKTCKSTFRQSSNYRFCSCIKRGYYPEAKPDIDVSKAKRSRNSSLSNQPLPGHKIVFLPCLEITNLLPCELNYFMEEFNISEFIKPGKVASLYNIDIMKNFLFGISFDNFKRCKKISISASSRHYPSRLELYDSQDRIIFLQLKILSLAGGAMKIYISAPYWLINKTGLPLVFKQEGSQIESAGQFEEHEMARSMVPLLFSFSDTEASVMCSMRIGKLLHNQGFPIWCTRFHLEKGVRVRRLHVGRNDSRPDWVYIIGIEVNAGKGRYKDTNIVTLSPRYYLDNRSRYTLEFCQKFALKEPHISNSVFAKSQKLIRKVPKKKGKGSGSKKYMSTVKHVGSPNEAWPQYQNRHFEVFTTSQYILSAVPNCSLPYHWPRIDLDNLLCVRIADTSSCKWSGGFAIDGNKSFHINMRNGDGVSQFLQTEITLHGATYYVIFSDADNLPPPIRIDNHSEVSVTYYQTNVTEERLKTAVRAHSSVPYAWDESMLPPYITCSAPGGSVATYNMNVFREGNQLFYENFIYIAFSGTFLRSEPKVYPSRKSEIFPEGLLEITDQELVLDVPFGTAVVLSRKEAGKRSQLWRMTSNGMLQHEGSTPPLDLHKSQTPCMNTQKLVLDIAGLGAQPEVQIPLMLRKPDARRQHTQTWKFTADGRLCCSHPNMYVQAKDGYGGLIAGNDAVLGPQMPCTFVTMENGVPVEQAICRQKLRGGSGLLSVKVIPDGPTRVLQITDFKQKVTQTTESDDFVVVPSTSSKTECFSLESSNRKKSLFDVQFVLKLPNGLGLSIVNHLNEELVYITLQDINIEFSKSASAISIDGSFRDIQVDNQIREAEKPVVLFVTPASKTDNQRHLPVVHFTLHRIETSLANADIFKHLIITVKNLTAHLEECLLMKLLQFFGFDQNSCEMEKFNENNNEIQSSLFHHVKNDRRYYFSTLKLSLQQLRLSVHTTDHLPADLCRIKHKIGLRLIRFEDAVIELDPYVRVHPFETAKCLMESIVDHYKEELKSQAAKILGAIDFLGNPLGLVNDVSDGISELIHEGNVGGLIKNVAHGLSNTAAKLSESLSDGLGLVVIDEKHQKMRRQIRQGGSGGGANAGNDHLMAGIRGLGIGIFGGVTSLITQTYEGAAQEGVQGFFSGFGKGLVGTVAKPAVGFLDLASGAASAVRDTSKRNSHVLKTRIRPPRIYVGPGGLLSRYYLQQALGQELLYNLNNQTFSELFIAKEVIRSEGEDVQVLISSERVYVMSSGSTSLSNVMLMVEFEDLYHCCYVCSHVGAVSESRHYLQLFIKDNSSASSPSSDLNNYPLLSNDERVCKKPQVRCDSKEVAEKVVMQISYAKSLFEERISMVPNDDDPDNPFG